MRLLIKPIFFCAMLCISGLPVQAEGRAAPPTTPSTTELNHYRIQGTAQGTTYDIHYYSMVAAIDKDQIDSLLEIIDLSMSLYRPGSLIRQFNQETTLEIEMDEHFQKVIERSFEINRWSGGIFDITVAPLMSLWGFGVTEVSDKPTEDQIRETLAMVGMEKLSVQGSRLKKCCPGIQIDLNGIAQGYTVDFIATYLEDYGIFNYLVELGGELRVSGKKSGDQPFRIGIERPDQSSPYVIFLPNGALTSSGRIPFGSRISHHIDPRTGYPFAESAWRATVFARDAMTADALDNVLIVMDEEEANKLLVNFPNVEFLITFREEGGELRDVMSSGFRQMLQ